MPRYIIKIRDLYFDWSTIVDAPVTYGMTRERLEAYLRDEYGRRGTENLAERMARVESNGTSCVGDSSVADTVAANRAGPDETELSVDEIYQRYASPPK